MKKTHPFPLSNNYVRNSDNTFQRKQHKQPQQSVSTSKKQKLPQLFITNENYEQQEQLSIKQEQSFIEQLLQQSNTSVWNLNSPSWRKVTRALCKNTNIQTLHILFALFVLVVNSAMLADVVSILLKLFCIVFPYQQFPTTFTTLSSIIHDLCPALPNSITTNNQFNSLHQHSSNKYYCEIFNLKEQIVLKLEDYNIRKAWATTLQQIENLPTNCVASVCTGNVYREYIKSNQYQNCNLTITIFIDGMQAYNSGDLSVTPMFATVNEWNTVTKREHTLLLGLFGCRSADKAQSSYFKYLEIAVKQLNEIAIEGFDIRINNNIYRCHCYTKALVCDLKEKAELMNLALNGYYGCLNCEDKGTYSSKVAYNSYTATARCTSKIVIEQECSKRGFHGTSPIMNLINQKFEFPRMVPFEPQHTLELGVYLNFIELLTDSKNWFSDSFTNPIKLNNNQIAMLDRLIQPTTYPHKITRVPSSLLCESSMKSDQYRTLVQFTLLPYLREIGVPERFVHHMEQFLRCIRVLDKPFITWAELDCCELMLAQWVKQWQTFYGEKAVTLKLHQVLHLCESVRDYGKVSNISSKHFEDMNGLLKQLNTAKKLNPLQHIASKFISNSFLSMLYTDLYKLLKQEQGYMFSDAAKFLKLLEPYVGIVDAGVVTDFGAVFSETPSSERERTKISNFFKDTVNFESIVTYKKCVVNSDTFKPFKLAQKTSSRALLVGVENNTQVYYYGTIDTLFKFNNTYYVLADVHSAISGTPNLFHQIHRGQFMYGTPKVFRIEALLSTCVVMHTPNSTFWCPLDNSCFTLSNVSDVNVEPQSIFNIEQERFNGNEEAQLKAYQQYKNEINL